MLTPKYVYILKRVGDKEAEIIFKRQFWNAPYIERRLHKVFKECRFNLFEQTKNNSFFNNHYKIGFSDNPERRLRYINKSELKEGFTEWFRLNDFELFCAKKRLKWYWWRWYLLYLILLIIGTFVISR